MMDSPTAVAQEPSRKNPFHMPDFQRPRKRGKGKKHGNRSFLGSLVNATKLTESNPHALAHAIQMEINSAAVQIFAVWDEFQNLLRVKGRKVCKQLRKDYQAKVEEKLGESIFRNVVTTHDFAQPSEDTLGHTNTVIAKKKRTLFFDTDVESRLEVEEITALDITMKK